MPYIAVNTSKVFSEEQKDALKAVLGEKITLLSGKSEKALMIDISDNRAMYLRGEKGNIAYLDVKIYGTAVEADKKAFVEAAFDAMEQFEFEKKNVYVTFSEFPNWGANGTMK